MKTKPQRVKPHKYERVLADMLNEAHKAGRLATHGAYERRDRMTERVACCAAGSLKYHQPPGLPVSRYSGPIVVGLNVEDHLIKGNDNPRWEPAGTPEEDALEELGNAYYQALDHLPGYERPFSDNP